LDDLVSLNDEPFTHFLHFLTEPAFLALFDSELAIVYLHFEQMPAASVKDVLRRPVGIRSLPITDGRFVSFVVLYCMTHYVILFKFSAHNYVRWFMTFQFVAVPLVFCFHSARLYVSQVHALARASTREKLSRYSNNAVSVYVDLELAMSCRSFHENSAVIEHR
jgi:hypothetical protein